VGFVGSLVPSQHPDLLAIDLAEFVALDGIEGVMAYRSERRSSARGAAWW
jgi:hypothetical protein